MIDSITALDIVAIFRSLSKLKNTCPKAQYAIYAPTKPIPTVIKKLKPLFFTMKAPKIPTTKPTAKIISKRVSIIKSKQIILLVLIQTLQLKGNASFSFF